MFLRLDITIECRGGFRIEVRVIENVFVQQVFPRPSSFEPRSTRIRRRPAVRL
jgi:hypothetical protein